MSYTNGLDKPTDYFNTKLYTGNSSTNVITGVGFQPDLVWIKDRDDTSFHTLFDLIRGATKRIFTNSTNAEDTQATSLTSFDSDGFTLGSHAGTNSNTNHVSWNWLAGGSASSNTEGNVTTSVSANTTAGFSVVTYSGNSGALTIGHGLNAKPSMVIVKNRTDNSSDWIIGHKDLSSGGGGFDDNKFLKFDTSTTFTNSLVFGTEPTTTTIALTTGNAGNLSTSGKDYVAYCFAEKKGYSKFGSYTGNGNADGTFVYTGFKPAFILGKNTNAANGWYMFDNKRDVSNVVDTYLVASDSAAEATYTALDFLSNGFKVRATNSDWNGSGNEIIYMAFAEAPFVSSGGIPTTAR